VCKRPRRFAIRPRESAFGMHTRVYVTRMQIGTYYFDARLPILFTIFMIVPSVSRLIVRNSTFYTAPRLSTSQTLFPFSPNRATCLAQPFANYFVHEGATRGQFRRLDVCLFYMKTETCVSRAPIQKNSIRNINSISEMISGRLFLSQTSRF